MVPDLFRTFESRRDAPMHKTAQAKAANALNPCCSPCCHLPRYGLQLYCAAHSRTASRYGHPTAGPVKRSELIPFRKEVEALLSANEAHPGLQQVVAFLERWMAEAHGNPRAFKGAQELARLHAHGVDARMVLVEFLAGTLWQQQHGHRLPDDRARDFHLSRAVFGLAPRPRRPTGTQGGGADKAHTPASHSVKALPSALAHVGRFLRQSLDVFVANVMAGVEAERRNRADPTEAPCHPCSTQMASTPQPGARPH